MLYVMVRGITVLASNCLVISILEWLCNFLENMKSCITTMYCLLQFLFVVIFSTPSHMLLLGAG